MAHDHVIVFLIYLPQTKALLKRISRVRRAIRDQLGMPTTVGFGPRYLHSTGQIYKGGTDRILCIMVTAEPRKDIDVPDGGITFGVLERAQALGDLQALNTLGRKTFGIHLREPTQFRDIQASMLAAIDILGSETKGP